MLNRYKNESNYHKRKIWSVYFFDNKYKHYEKDDNDSIGYIFVINIIEEKPNRDFQYDFLFLIKKANSNLFFTGENFNQKSLLTTKFTFDIENFVCHFNEDNVFFIYCSCYLCYEQYFTVQIMYSIDIESRS